MPEEYKNPTNIPTTGSYTWVPTPPTSIGGINFTSGFSNLIIDRGTFRNYYVRRKNNETFIKIQFFKNKTEGYSYNPIINATRPLALGFPVLLGNGNNFVIKEIQETNVLEFEFLQFQDRPLSCIQITYDLSVWRDDPNYLFKEKPEQPVILVYGVKSSGEEQLIQTEFFKGLPITRTRTNLDESGQVNASNNTNLKFNNLKIKFVEEILDRSKFTAYKKVIFKINPSATNFPTSLIFVVKKIMFFSADRTNFRFQEGQKQLPCAALGYSMAVQGKFFPTLSLQSNLASSGGSIGGSASAQAFGIYVWPEAISITPTISVKLFNPDFITGSPGFSHSLDLRIFVFVQPLKDPQSLFIGIVDSQLYNGVIIGPQVFTQQLLFFGFSDSENLNLATINSAIFKKNSGQVNLEQNGQVIATKSIFTYQAGFEYFLKNQFYYEQQGVTNSDSFRNIYIDQFGISNPSDIYSGTLPRTKILNAKEATTAPPANLKLKRFVFNTYLFKDEPNLYELFKKSSPCLTFKLNPTGSFSQLSLDSGFLYSAINCFVSEPNELLDTRLVFRVFASPKINDVSSSNPESQGTRTFKIVDSGTADSTLESTEVDKTWNFSNVLVTGVISSRLQQVETSEIINNSKKGTFNPLPNNESYDLYCAIYAFSNPNDSFANYNADNFSSLNLPVITFVIKDDFILQLPLYYRKSLVNGGTLQPQRFPGLKGSYTAETDTFTIITTTYGGSSVSSKPYSKTIDNPAGVNDLFVALPNTQETNTSFTILVNQLVSKNSYFSRTDYVILFDSTSNSRINAGEWILNFTADFSENVSIKFEINLVDKQTNKLILKLASSKYEVVTESTGTNKATITVPFFLPQTEGLIILKLFFISSEPNAIIDVNKIVLEKNTLEYFSFNPGQVGGFLIGFYEDLPVQPTSYVAGGSTFIFKLEKSNGTTQFSIRDGLPISGALYSATWAVNLPENMELTYDAFRINGSRTGTIVRGVEPYKIFFRTGQANDIKVVDTKRHDNGLIITAANTKTNLSENSVLQIVSESYYRNTSFSNLVKTPLANLNLVELEMSRPLLTRTDNRFIPIGLFGQVSANNNLNSIFLSMQAPGFYAAQAGDNGTLLPVSNPAALAVKIQSCFFTVVDYRGDQVYNVGVTANGNLIISFSQSAPTANGSNFTLIEGDPNNAATSQDLEPFKSSLYKPSGPNSEYFFNGPASVTYPGLLVTNESPIVFYVFKQTSNLSANAKSNREKNKIIAGHAIYARVVDAGNVSKAFLVFDFKKYCETNSSVGGSNTFSFSEAEFPNINQITVCKNDVYLYGQNFNLAFDSGNKIFVLRGAYTNNNCFVYGLGIAYGNLKPTSTPENKFIQVLNSLIANSSLTKFKYVAGQGVDPATFKPYEANLEQSQRVGFVDYDGINIGLQFYIGSEIYEVLVDKSYVLVGKFRKIGEVNE